MYDKSNDFGEGSEREYFIEVEHLNTSVTSQVIPISPSAEPVKVDPNDSPAIIKEPKQEKKEEKVCECEARVRAFIRMVRVGEGTGELIKSYDKKEKKTIYITHDFQAGYTMAFGGTKITNLSTHPQTIYKIKSSDQGSSAAGAYQVMRYTWWELAGFEVKNKKKTGKYFEDRDLLKKHNVIDYSAESQDKICVILMEKQRPNLINKIIANKIEDAIQKDGCFIWASLPEINDLSHYYYNDKRQPATPLKTCMEHYNDFFQEELKGNSNLHLKKGFLKEFGYDCCKGNISNLVENNGTCKSCHEDHYDLTDKVKWQTQFDSKWGDTEAQKVACKKTCDDILNKVGLANTSKAEADRYQTALENDKHTTILINSAEAKQAVQYINEQLKNGNPVQVGVDHALNYKGGKLNEGTTDHFVIIIGKACENNKIYYRFYDVGTRHNEKGASKNNKLFLKSDNSLKGTTVYSGQTYLVTQVRKNKKK